MHYLPASSVIDHLMWRMTLLFAALAGMFDDHSRLIAVQFRTHPPCGLSILTVSEMYDTLLVEAFS